jgi:hypothetical protein
MPALSLCHYPDAGSRQQLVERGDLGSRSTPRAIREHLALLGAGERHEEVCRPLDLVGGKAPPRAVIQPHEDHRERKGRTRAEVDEIVRWLTGHSQASLEAELAKKTSFEDFFARAPEMNPSRFLITGVVCGVRVEEIEEPMMREIRYLDKLIDELAKGKAMEKNLRK